jgi:hypothetical protein
MPVESGTKSAQENIDLNYAGKTVSLPLVHGSEGEVAIDIQKLRAAAGLPGARRSSRSHGC